MILKGVYVNFWIIYTFYVAIFVRLEIICDRCAGRFTVNSLGTA